MILRIAAGMAHQVLTAELKHTQRDSGEDYFTLNIRMEEHSGISGDTVELEGLTRESLYVIEQTCGAAGRYRRPKTADECDAQGGFWECEDNPRVCRHCGCHIGNHKKIRGT